VSDPTPIPGTATPVGPLDPEGADEAKAFTVQARVFGGLAVFLVAVSIGYGIWTKEYAGTVLLLLTGALTGLCGAYLGWRRREPPGGDGAGDDAGDDEPWFPAGSIWPFAVGVGAALVGNGLLLGLWLLLPAGVALAAAIGGFAAQSRRRR
jgi:hypothetical protein